MTHQQYELQLIEGLLGVKYRGDGSESSIQEFIEKYRPQRLEAVSKALKEAQEKLSQECCQEEQFITD